MKTWQRLKCLLGRHDWRLSRFVALNCRGPCYQCEHCRKVVQHD